MLGSTGKGKTTMITVTKKAIKVQGTELPRDTWITNESELAELISRDRLASVLVRYRGKTEGRFRAAAQDVPDLIQMLTDTNHYVRDICY